jgi:glycosyltransferase involved in cell wall biosynthesis
MRLLWLKYGEILPVDTGGKLRSFHLLRQLSRQIDLTFLSYVDTDVSADYARQLREEIPGSQVEVAPDMPRWRRPALLPVVRSLRTGAPLNVTRFTSTRIRQVLTQALASNRYDILLCDFLTPSLCVPEGVTIPTVLFEHNVECLLWGRRTATMPPGPRRWLYQWETNATRRWEQAMLERHDLTLAVSDADRDALQQMAPRARVEVVETGVDAAALAPREDSPPRRRNLVLFVGSMDWQPNEDGVLWFLDAVWPQVRAAVPDAVFRMVGRRPTAPILARRAEGIEVTGDVESVVPHLHEATMSVVPLRAGGGTRLKIYESMAGGLPVVSTTIGAEGLAVTPGRDIVIADTADGLATEIIDLLRTPERCTALEAAGRATAQSADWSAVVKRLVDVLGSVRR